MQSASLQGSQGPLQMADLFCTTCDSQIGTYENEWIRLTSSYVISKVNGTKFGIIVADEHRTVDGKEATALHACVLSEASCSKCSKAIGHFCRNAPGKPHLVGQYIYKLSKTQLRLSGTPTHVAFNLICDATRLQQDRARSTFTAHPRPIQSPPPCLHGVRNETARISMGPRNSRPDSGLMIDPTLASASTPPNDRESSTQSVELTGEEKYGIRETSLILERLEEQDNKLFKMSESINDWKIQNGKLLAALIRSDLKTFTEQDTSGVLETMIDDFESMVDAAYESRSGNHELEILRAENESMKAKLQTIALAMGSAIENATPASQCLSSPKTASSTPSVLGKRRRIDARSRHSRLQNEVSFTDDVDLNDHSEFSALSNITKMMNTPARQSERQSTPLLSSARVSQQQRETPAATNTTIENPTASLTGGSQTLEKTSAPMLTPPYNSFTEQYGRESRSTEPARSLDGEPKCSANTATDVNRGMYEENAWYGLGHNTDDTEFLKDQELGTVSLGNRGNDSPQDMAPTSRPRRAHKSTPTTAAPKDAQQPRCVAGAIEQRQNDEASPIEHGSVELHKRETRAIAVNASRRKSSVILPGDAHITHEIGAGKEQRRRTTNALPEGTNFNHGEPDESSRETMQQSETRTTVSQLQLMQETDKANGYVEPHEEVSGDVVDANIWQEPSMMTFTNDEEREELFEGHQGDQHLPQMNGNNKENEKPYYAHSADDAQNKQWSRRDRDPNRPKRARRKPDEIKRKYVCLFSGCTKAYGALPHLNTHITDSSHGERWTKVDYLEACTKKGDNCDERMDRDDSLDLDRVVDERNAAEAVAALKRDPGNVNRAEKLRQRDRMAKEAMEREEMMEFANEM